VVGLVEGRVDALGLVAVLVQEVRPVAVVVVDVATFGVPRVALRGELVVADVVVDDRGRIPLEGRLHVEDAVQSLVGDVDERDRLLGNLLGLGRDDGDRFAHVSDLLFGQDRLVEDELSAFHVGGVAVGGDRVDAVQRSCGRDVDPRDLRVCVRTCHEFRVQQIAGGDVHRVHGLTRHLRRCVGSRDRLADVGGLRFLLRRECDLSCHGQSLLVAAASLTASTIFT
jgi:hypothetical protein